MPNPKGFQLRTTDSNVNEFCSTSMQIHGHALGVEFRDAECTSCPRNCVNVPFCKGKKVSGLISS